MNSFRTVSRNARAALASGVLAIGGLAGCGTPSTTGTPPRTTFPKTTVYQLLVPTTATPTSTRSALPVADAAGTIAGGQPPTAVAAGAGPAAAPGAPTSYTVQSNDLLVRIAKRFGCRYTEILAANNYTGDPNKFLPAVGRTISLPATCKQTAPSASTTIAKGTKTPTTVKAASTTTTAKGGTTPTTARSGAGAATYTVVANDTLSGIARKSGTTIQAIIAANGWADGASHRINPGDVITLPAKMA